ncbi:DNA polymerase III subunit beta [Patescibacteria group bacterium]|nr:DNA polymerase III subunit beta [Patescibacteria group bacterium]MBU4601112.1 DNA polymerase III subunit beta [Patescibacteria group bacterium]MCG2698475.1 DNA polymerase III subunit beta [Candidatus Parcubacteria bacterium]
MKLICLQNNLKHGLFVAGHIAGKNINLPILSNILIKTKEGKIQIIATNLEMGIISAIRGKIEKEGCFTVNSKIISDYVGLLPNKKVSIEKKENSLIINCENYKTKINGQSAEEFPLIPEVDKKNFYSANISEFKEALSQAVFAVSTSESRIELSGVLFCFENSALTMAATDSYRLAEKKISIKSNGEESKKIIVPAKTLQELLRILSSAPEMEGPDTGSEEIKFYISENQILFSCGPTELVSRLIEGQYPDYEQIIPSNIKTKASISRAEFLRAVKAASLFSKTGINDVNLDFPAGKNSIIVSAISGQAGENVTELSAGTSGSDNSIVINYRYLLDGLNNMGSEFISIELVDGNTPCILRPADPIKTGDKKQEYLYIIMPIKQ